MKEAGLVILKFVLALLILPLVIGSTSALQGQISGFDAVMRYGLWMGLVTYLVLKFFVYDFGHVYRFGQGLVTSCFQFLKPLVNVAPYLIPIYTVIVFLVYAFVASIGRLAGLKEPLCMLISATFLMHLILTAEELYEKDSAAGKPAYFLGMQLVYIFDVFFIALVINAILPGFSFTQFFQALSGVSFDIYRSVFVQLFSMHSVR